MEIRSTLKKKLKCMCDPSTMVPQKLREVALRHYFKAGCEVRPTVALQRKYQPLQIDHEENTSSK